MKITKDMAIAEIIQKHPEAMDIMMKFGLYCIGCHVSAYESLEDGGKAHGMSDADVNRMIKEMNNAVNDNSALSVSKEALKKLREELKDSKNGLRISENGNKVIIVVKAEKDDIVLESGGIRIFIEKKSEENLKGKRLDFKDGDYFVE